MPGTFGKTDFKLVDDQPDNYQLKGLKVWGVWRGAQGMPGVSRMHIHI